MEEKIIDAAIKKIEDLRGAGYSPNKLYYGWDDSMWSCLILQTDGTNKSWIMKGTDGKISVVEIEADSAISLPAIFLISAFQNTRFIFVDRDNSVREIIPVLPKDRRRIVSAVNKVVGGKPKLFGVYWDRINARNVVVCNIGDTATYFIDIDQGAVLGTVRAGLSSEQYGRKYDWIIDSNGLIFMYAMQKGLLFWRRI